MRESVFGLNIAGGCYYAVVYAHAHAHTRTRLPPLVDPNAAPVSSTTYANSKTKQVILIDHLFEFKKES